MIGEAREATQSIECLRPDSRAVYCAAVRCQFRKPSTKMRLIVLALSLLLAAPAVPRAGQEEEEAAAVRTVRALPLGPDERIELNGRLTEAAWDRAEPAGEFVQQEPIEGGTPTESTEVYVLYSRDELYIGAILYDSDPTGILGHQKQRDQGLGTDDRFMWMLDTFLDGRTGYFFETNPAGLLGDGLMRAGSGFGGVSKQWDGIWMVKTARGEYGWSVEIEIPFRTLNFDPTSDTWGINFQRTVRRKQEELVWSGHRRNQGLFRPIHAGRLTGLQGISQGLGLEVTPYGATAWRDVANERTEMPAAVGFDLNYNVTSSLKAAVSVNTDFAETEVDRRRVNLTRFSLFFPEQRDFFLENASVFNFSPASRVIPFFSRQIGLADGMEVPILFGSRLTGQAGSYDLGFLQVRTDESDELGGEDFTVGRVKRNFWRQSTIGAIYTRRATGAFAEDLAPLDRHTIGADLDLSTSTFLGDKNLQFETFYVWHNDPERDGTASTGDRSAHGIRFNYPNDIWRAHVSYRELGEEFSPAMGFTSRNGFRRVQPSLTWAPRPERWKSVRQLEFGIFYEHLLDLDNVLQTRQADFTLLQVRYQSGDNFSIRNNNRFERLDDSFEISDGVTLPVGEYRFSELRFDARSANQRPVSGRIGYTLGGFWSGSRRSSEVGVSVRPVQGVTISTDWERDDVTLPQGEFTTDLVRLSGAWHLSPWASVTGNVQYDTVSEIVGLFTRLRWILTPGSDFFLVYTQNWQYDRTAVVRDARLLTLSRGATTKINYTHRF